MPPRRQLLAGGGSLAATSMQLRLQQNHSAALSAEPEIDQILGWFTAEAAIDKGAPAKLWDGVTWHRPVMDKSRAFTVPSPWYGFIAGARIPELFRATTTDTFGLRQRVMASFGAPAWSDIGDIRAACVALPVSSGKRSDCVSALLYPLLRWSVSRPRGQVYTPAHDDGAHDIVDRKFNEHKAMQKQ